ncbi:MAG: hypothetical protein LBL52_04040 [Rickettsiales bacterium]|jgi:hypothetical protein|nr:hypothetical protein [Rickettsiales bacterium]
MAEEKKDGLSFADYQIREKNRIIAKTYLNIFRQLHVIDAGLPTLNSEFVTLPNEVIDLLPEVSGGQKLWQHIKNLKDGSTPMDKIDAMLLPFGGEVFTDKKKLALYTEYTHAADKAETAPAFIVSAPDSAKGDKDVLDALRSYKNTPEGLEAFKQKMSKFGANWRQGIDDVLAVSTAKDKDELVKTFDGLKTFDTALSLWQEAASVVKTPTAPGLAKAGANMVEYEKYLPMFGPAGTELLNKLKGLK